MKSHPAALSASAQKDKEALSALETVANSLSGKNLTDQEIKALSKDIQTNKETQSAVKSITASVSSHQVKVNYCPVDGERFDSRVKACPRHKVELKEVEE